MGRKYEPSLDGVRALSALAVLFYHAHVPVFWHGDNGVPVFFVLSGYLITTILTDEVRAGGIELRRFWMRRVRRLLPALFVLVAATLIFGPMLVPDEAPRMMAAAFFASTYTMDVANIFGFPMTPLSHTWTLALEMQFYLLWPYVVRAVANLRRPVAVLLGVWGLICLASIAIAGSQFKAWLPLFDVSGLIFGSAIALVPPIRPALGWLGAALILAITFVPMNIRPEFIRHLPLLDVGAGLLVGSLSQRYALSRALSWAPLVWLGAISYGIYLWHFPILEALRGRDWEIRALLATAFAVAMARLSYLTVETWGRRLGRKAQAVAASV